MGDQIDIGRLTSDEGYRQELRHRMQTDLYWLAKYVLGYDRISEKYHREAINLFVKKDPSKPLREQTRKRRRILLMPRKTYKALALDTRIPTPDGFTTMGKIKVGDTVFGEDGKPCKVVGCSPVYTSRTCYQLEFSTGETVTADAGHLWITDARRDRDNRKNRRDHGGRSQPYPQIRTTEEIAATVNIRRENNHRIKLAAPLDLPDVDLPISPYVLGCWLGDGHSNAGRITCGEKELVDEILAEGEVIRECSYKSSYGYVFNGGEGHVDYRQRSGKPFQSRIRNLNLLGNKHIPALYLRASYHQRLALLQGLMDTDGNAAKRDGQVVFCNTNLRLCKEVRELVNSLGIKARIQGPYDANLNGKKAGSFWQVAFKPYDDTRIFRLERK